MVQVCFFKRRWVMKRLIMAVALLVAFAAGVALQPYAAGVWNAVVTAAMTEAERDSLAVERTITLIEQGRVGGLAELRLRDALGHDAELAELRRSIDEMRYQLREQDRRTQDLLAEVSDLNRALTETKRPVETPKSDVEVVLYTLPYEAVERFAEWGSGVLTSFIKQMRLLHEVHQVEKDVDADVVVHAPQRETIDVSDGLILEVFEDGSGMLFRTLQQEEVPYGTGALALCKTHFRAETVPATAFGGVAVTTEWDRDVLCLNAITSHERNQNVVASVLSQRTADGMLNLDAWKHLRHGEITVPVAYISDVATSSKTVAELLATK